MLLFLFPTSSSPKSCPLAEAIQQVNALIFKKYWRSDPLDYQIVSKDFGVKQVKSLIRPPRLLLREVTGPIRPPKLPFPGGRWSNLTPRITLPGRSLVQSDPPNYPSREVGGPIRPPKLAFREVGGPIWPPKLPFREVGGPIRPPRLPLRAGRYPNLTPQITPPGRSTP